MKDKILNEQELVHRGKYIQWKSNIGKTLDILFNNKKYKMTIIDVFNTKSAIMVQLKWNENILKPMASSMIKNMNFKNILEPSNLIKDDILKFNFKIDYEKTINKLKYTKEFINKLTVGSEFRLYFKCKLCGTSIESPLRYRDLIDNKGHIRRCNFCGDKISIGEKFIGNLLNKLNIDFIKELGATTFCWCDKYKYDFYFEYNNEKYIIETHGEQHYRNIGRGRTLKEEQINDKHKKELALKNNINNYIVLNCSKENEIKNNILKSNLIKIIQNKNINWEEIYHNCFQPILFDICEQWKIKGNTRENLLDICNEFKISEFKARKILKTGETIGLCKYDKEQLIRNRIEKQRKNKTTLND